jgi:hypothetical protein
MPGLDMDARLVGGACAIRRSTKGPVRFGCSTEQRRFHRLRCWSSSSTTTRRGPAMLITPRRMLNGCAQWRI